LQQRREAARQVAGHLAAAEAALQKGQARDREAEALRRQALARFDAGDTPGGEAAWAQALGMEAEAGKRYADAGRALDGALVVDSRRADVRRRFAELLYHQALLAERAHRPAQRDELFQRLRTYDPEGERVRRADAP